jgi:hypothetical protein
VVSFLGYLKTLSVARLYNIKLWDDDNELKGFGRIQLWPNQDTTPAFSWREKSHKKNSRWLVSQPRRELRTSQI